MSFASLLQAFPFKRKIHKNPDALRLGVIGLGKMGQNHLKVLDRLPEAVITGIVDTDALRRNESAQRFSTTAYENPIELHTKVDAVIIVTPTETHFTLGKQFLEAGIPCFIEKPIAKTLEEADQLISLATSKNVLLQIGHIERFNPAVLEAAKVVRNPRFIDVNRLGPYDPRMCNIGVVLDLMIHDLDIVQFLVAAPVDRVEAFGAKVLSKHEDIAKVRLSFQGGGIADLTASRISLQRYRRIRIFQNDAYLSLDYAKPSVKIYRKKQDDVKSLLDVAINHPTLTNEDPLTRELRHFLDCVRTHKKPSVSGKDGRDALELAQRVLAELKIYD